MRDAGRRESPLPLRIALGVARLLYPFVILGIAWWCLARWLDRPFAVPTPGDTWDRAIDLWRGDIFGMASLRQSLMLTVTRIVLAFALAATTGVIVGSALGRVRWFRQMFGPLVVFGFPIPKLAVYPGIVIALGLGTSSKVVLGFLEAFFPIVLATSAATSQVPEKLLWSARSVGYGRVGLASGVVLPAAAPGILTGLRVGLVGAIIGVFLGEMIFPSSGVGAIMVGSYRTIDAPGVYVAVASISVIGFIADQLFLSGRRRLLHWSPEGG